MNVLVCEGLAGVVEIENDSEKEPSRKVVDNTLFDPNLARAQESR